MKRCCSASPRRRTCRAGDRGHVAVDGLAQPGSPAAAIGCRDAPPARDPSQASTGAAPARHHRRRPMSTPRRSSTITGGVNEMNPITAPADLGRRCGGARPTDRLVQGVPAPGRARPGRDGRALRGRYHGTGVAKAAGLRQLSQPTGRLLATGAKRCHLMALPRLQPIIPTLRKEPFDDPGWLFDGRYGFPALCYVERGRARFVSRNGKSLDRFAALRAEVAAELAVDEAVLERRSALRGILPAQPRRRSPKRRRSRVGGASSSIGCARTISRDCGQAAG